ncbi:MAG: ABC transporter permease [Bryobacteraceae bacterium]
MNWIERIFSRRQLHNDASEEIREHLSEKIDELVNDGVPRSDAEFLARRQFGNVTLLEERSRETWRWPLVETFFADLRYAIRQLRKSPGFALAVIVTLALGIGANTAVFSVINAVMLRPLPYAQPERLVSFRSLITAGPQFPVTLSYPNFFDFRRYNRVFEHLVCYRNSEFTLTGVGQPVHLDGEIVSWDLFPVVGMKPALGRGFRPDEEKPGTHVVILSDELWKAQFGGDRGIIGRSVEIDRQSFTVVGIAPPRFHFPVENQKNQLWTTIAWDAFVTEGQPLTEQRGAWLMRAIARLKPGVSIERAKAQMDGVAASLAKQYPDQNSNITQVSIRPALEALVGDTRQPLFILMGAVGLVLLIACANVANLLLARTAERSREFSVRAAIGASRGSIVRQLLTENLLMAVLGGMAGALFAFACMRAILPLAGNTIPRLAQASIDGPVLGFCMMLALVTTVLFSFAPAIQAAKVELIASLREGTRGLARGHNRLRGALVIAQITLGLILLSGAGLLISSFLHLELRDPGFRPDHLLTFRLSLPDTQYPDSKQITFYSTLLEKLRSLPGVKSAAAGGPLPLTGDRVDISFNIQERPTSPSKEPHSDLAIVTPDYFITLGIPLIKGRAFTERDDAKAPLVLVVNKAFADKFFPGEDVIGKRIIPGVGTADANGASPVREIVGLVGNAKQAALSPDTEPIYYLPHKQLPFTVMSLILRTSLPPLALESAARMTVASLDPQVPMFEVSTMDDLLSSAIASPRFHMLLLGSFAGIALLLTVVGLYGVMAYSVLQRTREIGVRIAIGADRGMVLGMVLKQAMTLVFIGLVIGLAGAIAADRLLTKMLYGVTPHNPALLAIACCLIAATGVIAGYLPALRASSVDPVEALRSE